MQSGARKRSRKPGRRVPVEAPFRAKQALFNFSTLAFWPNSTYCFAGDGKDDVEGFSCAPRALYD
jgi:hypothetical protein